MALIVCVSKPVKDRPVKAQCETLVFESDEEGRKYAEENSTFVFSVQKARLLKGEKKDPKFKAGDRVRDKYTNKVHTVASVSYVNGWVYSFDSLGWYLYGEEDLEAAEEEDGC